MMSSIVEAMYDEALAIAGYGDEAIIGDSEWRQHLTKYAVAVYRILEESVPCLTDDDLRASIAWDVVSNIRPGESIVDAVRRWIPSTWQEDLKRDAKGNLIVNPMNAYLLLKNHPDVRGTIRFNEFSKQIEISGGPLANRKGDEVDDIVTAAQDWIYSTEGVVMNYGDLGRRLVSVAFENAFDPIRDYLLGLKWDGTPRIMTDGGWLVRFAGARAKTPGFVAQVGRKYLLGAVARGLRPGAKVDNVLVLCGDQGLKKSALFEALGGPFYVDTSIALGDKDSKMMAGAAWIAELPDMASFKRSEKNAMKAFFTTRIDKYRAPFGRAVKSFPRRCVWGTTSNDDEIFDDETGSRRYLTLTCFGVDGQIDVAGVMRERDQLWAEAVAIYRASETCPSCAVSADSVWDQSGRCPEHSWWPDREMARIVAVENGDREDDDVWTPLVLAWLERPVKNDVGIAPAAEAVPITTLNILLYAVGKRVDMIGQFDKSRIGKIMKRYGWIADKPHRGQRIYIKDVPRPVTSPSLTLVKK